VANLQPISISDYPQIAKLLKQIQSHKSAWPFLDPVDAAEAPNYYKVIKEPMGTYLHNLASQLGGIEKSNLIYFFPIDLQTVEVRVEGKCYTRLRDFIGDITKIFDNCRYYNPAESPFFKSAEILEAFFTQKIKLLREKLIESHSESQLQ
jgi:nucleosome-remodeling factor subunit BPTF